MSSTWTGSLCLVEDDPIMGESIASRLRLEGIQCDWYQDGRSAMQALRGGTYSLLVSDIRLPDVNGEEIFESLLEEHQHVPTLFITGYGAIDQAVRLLRKGARDYIAKPFDLDAFVAKLQVLAPELVDVGGDVEPLLGVSPAMRRIQRTLMTLGRHSVPVLLTGESGVGKEHAARFLHDQSHNDSGAPYLAVNCSAVPESLLEAELFGHEKGAFTGATAKRTGIFERAHGGTLLLDEVGEMTASMQAKLLRVLQDGVFERVGGSQPINTEVRVVCATNRDLPTMVDGGQFRGDLFYRINAVCVHLPPLRERPEDIIWFANRFLADWNEREGRSLNLAPDGEVYLSGLQWPGNVRELKHIVDGACIFSEGSTLGARELAGSGVSGDVDSQNSQSTELRTYLEQCESIHIRNILTKHAWRVADTAEDLGISRKSLWEKMKKYNLSRESGVR
ncbi:MAG: sigma-54 dependent transcriptional regulator [Gammaproteobacteria bacterium]|nr:sigma-54 dependent transcriptional regulator [Gammaproteobacteria bacterium]